MLRGTDSWRLWWDYWYWIIGGLYVGLILAFTRLEALVRELRGLRADLARAESWRVPAPPGPPPPTRWQPPTDQ